MDMATAVYVEGTAMRICIVGSGVVGLATAAGLKRQGHDVVCHDTSLDRRQALEADGWEVIAALSDAGACDVFFICVPTPPAPEGFDLSYVRVATQAVRDLLKRQSCPVVAVRSTVLPGTMRRVVLPVLEGDGRTLGRDFGLCYNPEFLRAATALDDLLHPPLTVVGEFDGRSADVVAQLHEPFGAPILRTTPENAEAIKCFSNAFNATKISFFNLLYLVCRSSGLDPEVVSKSLAAATTAIRFAEYGTPGGRPYQGACLPKDTQACISYTRQLGLDATLLQEVVRINEDMARRTGAPAEQAARVCSAPESQAQLSSGADQEHESSAV